MHRLVSDWNSRHELSFEHIFDPSDLCSRAAPKHLPWYKNEFSINTANILNLYRRIYVHTCIHTRIHACIHTCTHHTYIHIYIHNHAYMHPHRHIYLGCCCCSQSARSPTDTSKPKDRPTQNPKNQKKQGMSKKLQSGQHSLHNP